MFQFLQNAQKNKQTKNHSTVAGHPQGSFEGGGEEREKENEEQRNTRTLLPRGMQIFSTSGLAILV